MGLSRPRLAVITLVDRIWSSTSFGTGRGYRPLGEQIATNLASLNVLIRLGRKNGPHEYPGAFRRRRKLSLQPEGFRVHTSSADG